MAPFFKTRKPSVNVSSRNPANEVGAPAPLTTARSSRLTSARDRARTGPVPRQISAVGKISLTCWNDQRFQGGLSQSIFGGTRLGGEPSMMGRRVSEFLNEGMMLLNNKKAPAVSRRGKIFNRYFNNSVQILA